MKNILVLTDFSDCANAAAEYAIQLAQLADAEVHFVHLQSTPINWVKISLKKEKRYPQTLRAIGHARNELNMWVKKAEESGVKAEQFLTFNTEKEAVFRHINDHHHDFLVMGSHGTRSMPEKLLGSNAQQTLRSASVPVLIIKKAILQPIKNIAFVSDFTDVSRGSFHALTHFADILEAHIDLLFVSTSGQFTASAETSENMDQVMTHCNREDTCTRNVLSATSVEEGITDFIAEKPMDLVAICTHGKSGLQQLFSPSIAEQIAVHTALPLLSIKL